MLRSNSLAVALAATLVSPALAHTGVGHVTSFADGLAHPLGGADHILAMATLGLWAVSADGRRAIWIWPTTFVAAILAGFAAASAGLPMPSVETVIAFSVVALGLFVALAVKAPLTLGAAIAGLFAFFHGHAHGTEAVSESLIPYAAGFALTTAAVHAGAIGLGLFAKGAAGKAALRATGGVAALSGLALMVG
jgi:urease accessory protein